MRSVMPAIIEIIGPFFAYGFIAVIFFVVFIALPFATLAQFRKNGVKEKNQFAKNRKAGAYKK